MIIIIIIETEDIMIMHISLNIILMVMITLILIIMIVLKINFFNIDILIHINLCYSFCDFIQNICLCSPNIIDLPGIHFWLYFHLEKENIFLCQTIFVKHFHFKKIIYI